MTPKEAKLKSFIADYWKDHGHAPSYQEMTDGIGCKSKSEIDRLISGLHANGHITYTPYKARSVRIDNDYDTATVKAFLEHKGLTAKYEQWRAG